MSASAETGPHDALIGFATESLAFVAKLGEGGMGAVYKGRQIRLDRQVAIKVLSPRLVSDRAFLERFSREARLLAKLTHPHIVACHDFTPITGPDGELLHVLVMEFVDGCTIYQRSCEDMPVREALEMYRQAADGLAAAHRAGVLHRDLKPDNILVTKNKVAKIVDFGLAKHAAGDDSHHLTLAGVILGTPAYMAPEVCRGGEPTPVADCYSLACSLFHTLTGKPPFPWAVPLETIQHQINTPPPRLSSLRPELAPYDGMMERCLAKDPERRFADAAALTKVLEGAVATADGRPTTSGSTRFGTVRVVHQAEKKTDKSKKAEKDKPITSDDLDVVGFDRAERSGGGHGQAEGHDDRALAEADIPGLDDAAPPAPAKKSSTSASQPAPLPSSLELLPLPEKPKPVEVAAPPAEAAKPKGPSDEQLRAIEEKRKLMAKRSEALKNSGETPKGDAIGHERLGDLHAGEGRLHDAINEYRQAVATITKPDLRIPLETKIAHLESRLRQRLLIRAGLGLGVVAVLGLAAFVIQGLVSAPPPIGTSTTNATSGGAAAQEPSHEVAERIAKIKRDAKNPRIPWSDIRADIQAVLALAGSQQESLRRILAEADAYQQGLDATLAAIAAHWDSDPAAALAKSTALRHDDPRFDPALIPRLPVAGRLLLRAPSGCQPHITIDGKSVTYRSDSDGLVFCRHASRPTKLAVTAAGCEPWSQELPPSSDGATVTARLVAAPLWTLAATGPATLRAQHGLTLVITSAMVITVETATGKIQGTLGCAKISPKDGVTFSPRPLSGLRTDNAVLATSDGQVVSLPFATGGLHRVLFRTAHPAVDAVERDLVLRSGSRGRFVIEQDGPRFLLAAYKDGGEALWNRPLTAITPPVLAADDQQVVVVDDTMMRIFDQEGAVLTERALPPGERSAPTQVLADGAALMLPTATGLRLLRAVPGTGYEAAALPDHLTHPNPQVITRQDLLLATGNDGHLHLMRWQKHGFENLWNLPAPAARRWSGLLGLGADLACACDDQAVLHVVRLSDRRELAAITLREAPIGICMPSDSLVIVQDRQHRVMGYPLPR